MVDQIRGVDQSIAGVAKGFQSGARSWKASESGRHKAHPSANRYCRAQIQGYIYDFLMRAAGCVFSASCRHAEFESTVCKWKDQHKGSKQSRLRPCNVVIARCQSAYLIGIVVLFLLRHLRHQIGTLVSLLKSAVNRGPEVFDDSK